MNNWNWILKAIHSSIKKPFRDKCNKIMQDIYTLKTTKCCWEKLKKTQINRTVCHKHGLNDLVLLSQISPKLIYIFNSIHIKTLADFQFLIEMDQFCSVAQSCPTLCNPVNCSTPGFPVHHQLLELTQTHVHWVSDAISSSVVSFSFHLQSFPASESFQMSQFFTSGGQSIGVSASASVLPMKIQDWFPLGWTSWISLLIEMDKLILKFIWT